MKIEVTIQVNKVISNTIVNSAICIYVDEVVDNNTKRVLEHTTFGFCHFDDEANTTRARFQARDCDEWNEHTDFLTRLWKDYGIEAPRLVAEAVDEYYEKNGEENVEQKHTFQINK